MDIMGLSDPFVEIKLSKGTKTAFTTKVQDDKTDCFWENPGAIAIADVTADDLALMKMFVSVFDYDYDKNDLIGKSEYDLSKLVAANGSWLNDRVGLMDEKGFPEKSEIYIQCQWV
jgi:Ca2+-dependent lipid-binding protein